MKKAADTVQRENKKRTPERVRVFIRRCRTKTLRVGRYFAKYDSYKIFPLF